MATTNSKVKNKPTKTAKVKERKQEVVDPTMFEPFSSMIHPDKHRQLKVYAALHNKKLYEALNDVLNMGLFELNNR